MQPLYPAPSFRRGRRRYLRTTPYGQQAAVFSTEAPETAELLDMLAPVVRGSGSGDASGSGAHTPQAAPRTDFGSLIARG